ncbi:MAG: CHAT domain-containing protein [Oscillatoriales cyanobacterium]|nr:MAG: CHAT domain-containing protein [Oscillatoriales cyanobacterium]TAH15014.1 MAG: CHAT domain-containing protein [Oscillatoriales cyanobacterium]
MKRSHFLQFFGSTLATLSWGQLEAIAKGDRDASVLAQTHFSNLLSGSHSGPQLLAQTSSQQQALTIYQPIQNIEWEGMFVSPQGIAYFSIDGVSPDAVSNHEGEVEFARRNGDRQKEAFALFKLGLANHTLGGFFEKAIDYYKQSLVITKEIRDVNLEVILLGNIGLAYLQNGFAYIEPFEYLQQYLGLTWHKAYYYNGGDRRWGGVAMGNLGNAYYSADLYAKAIEFHQKRLALCLEIKDRRGESKALGDLGIVYHSLGEYKKAIEYTQKRLAIAREIKDTWGEGQAISNLGIVYHTLGNYTKAIEYQQQYLALAQAIKNPLLEEQALGNLGGAYYFLGDYHKAIELYEKSLAIAWKIRESQIANKVRANLGLVYFQMKNYQKSIELYNQFLSEIFSGKNLREQAIVRNNIAVVQINAGDLPGATTNLLKGIQILEALRGRLGSNDSYKISLFETQTFAYINLQKVLIAANKNDAALEIAERGRGRAFVELLEKRLSLKQTPGTTITPPNIEQIKQIAKTQNSTLVQYSIIYNDFQVKGIQKSQESELYIWVIKPTGEVTFRFSNLKSIWQEQQISLAYYVTSSREYFAARGGSSEVGRSDETSQTKRLKQLYQILIKPIADLLPNDPNAPVIFIPQKSLFVVPFPALIDTAGKYLIEKHTILTAPAIQVLKLTNQQRKQVLGDKVLVVGNPTMPSIPLEIGEKPEQLAPLPGAEKEALAIAKLLKTTAIIGNQATKSSIVQKMLKSRIIHLATHGLLDDFKGLGVPGAIALAPDPPSSLSKEQQSGINGLLTADEILDLKLNAELVVLSACDTGRGKITGDGVIGLSRSLITAGVSSVIVSLWPVPDEPTASLMSEFYQNLQKNPDKAQALRQAMLTTMKQYPEPKNWAAFTLIGEAK